MGGASAPMLLFQIAVDWPNSVGPEGPPTTAVRLCYKNQPSRGSTLTRICPSCTRAVSRSPGAASSTLRTTRPSSCWTMA
ncbi:DUF6053 domain-containing protein [Lysobacter enzymogenes]|uniref:DUF6053 domain-containing protein n=1 Tax=Lysobacter enzymogenes TaxID=69 RepID=UPI003CCCF41C